MKMHRWFAGVILVGMLMLAAMTGWAQEEAEACDTAEVSTELEALVSGLTESEDAAADLRAIRDLAANAAAQCGGLVFSSEEEGQRPVIGPVDLPEGLYRITATTEGSIIVEPELFDGDCELPGTGYFFAENSGEAADGAQITFESDGCSLLLTFVNASKDWTLTFEKLK